MIKARTRDVQKRWGRRIGNDMSSEYWGRLKLWDSSSEIQKETRLSRVD
jgi:hypothetical protein